MPGNDLETVRLQYSAKSAFHGFGETLQIKAYCTDSQLNHPNIPFPAFCAFSL